MANWSVFEREIRTHDEKVLYDIYRDGILITLLPLTYPICIQAVTLWIQQDDWYQERYAMGAYGPLITAAMFLDKKEGTR